MQGLMLRHAQLREMLETQLSHVKDLEARFLALRPESSMEDEFTRQEIKRHMVLARPWREELNATYRSIIATASELDGVTGRIHQLQGMLASAYSRR